MPPRLQVNPVMRRLRRALLGTGGALALTAALLTVSLGATGDVGGAGITRPPRVVTNNGIIYSRDVEDLSDLREDDDLAALEALAQGGVPGYCGDRCARALMRRCMRLRLPSDSFDQALALCKFPRASPR